MRIYIKKWNTNTLWFVTGCNLGKLECWYRNWLLSSMHTPFTSVLNEFFKQAFGFPMGAPLSPLLANLIMDIVETSAIQSFWLFSCFSIRIQSTYLNSDFFFLNILIALIKTLNFELNLMKMKSYDFFDILLTKRDNGLLFSI